MGTLDDSADVVPIVHMWARSRPAWVSLPVAAEIYEEAIPPDRLRAIFALNLT